jgi:hypothetical protein
MKQAAEPVLARTPLRKQTIFGALRHRRFAAVFGIKILPQPEEPCEGGKRAKERIRNDIFMGRCAGLAPRD